MPKLKKRKRKEFDSSIVGSHLNEIERALLEGDKRAAFLEFLNSYENRKGLYALYLKDSLYYIGKATDLKIRLNQHLKDDHADSWDRMSLFFLNGNTNTAELEGLLVATAKPPGNKQKPKIGKDLRKNLSDFLKMDSSHQIEQMVYPNKIIVKDKLQARITAGKLKELLQKKGNKPIADALNLTVGRISQLRNADSKNLTKLIEYIKYGGFRDRILILMEE